MSDKFSGRSDTVDGPARFIFAITPHATNPLALVTKAIRADTAGTVAFRAVGSTVDVSITMSAGEVLAVRAEFVRVAGTTAALHGLA